MSGVCYVTGTDTGVGKTIASTAMLLALRAEGQRAVGMKPIASGCARTPEGWRNEDALSLQAASFPSPEYAAINPFALPEATAPQIAAALAGVRIELAPIRSAYASLCAQAEHVVVEGVGGWLAPAADDMDQADLARGLEIEDVLLVVGLRLGCVNHARLSERAILADGFRLRGWIASEVDPALPHADAYFRHLSESLVSPCLGRMPFFVDAGAHRAWAERWHPFRIES